MRPNVAALLLFAVLAAHALWVKPLLPHAPWDDRAGVALMESVKGRSDALRDPEAAGPAYGWTLRAADRLTGGVVSVFSLDYLFSAASVLLASLLVYLLSGAGWAAVLTGGVLLFLPAHMRLSVTESPWVLVEFWSLAALCCLAGAARTRRGLWLPAAAVCFAALAYTRAEMAVLFPVGAGVLLWLLRRGFPAGAWRKPAAAAAGVLALAVCGLQAVPGASRLAGQWQWLWLHPSDGLLSALGLRKLNAFFDPGVTPALYMVLGLIGAFYAFRRSRRLFVGAGFYALWITAAYAPGLGTAGLRLSSGLATQFIFAALAAWGLYCLTEELGPRTRAAARVLAGVYLAALPFLYRDFLGTLYAHQQEYALLSAAPGDLPAGAVVAFHPGDGAPGSAELLQLAGPARRGGKPAVTLSLQRLFALGSGAPLARAYFYKGVDCYVVREDRDAMITRGMELGDSYSDPLCKRMAETFVLEPVRETKVLSRSLGLRVIEGDRRPIGLQRILGRRPRGPASAPQEPAPPASEWILLANRAAGADRADLAAAALARGEKSAGPRELEWMADLYQGIGQSCRALAVLKRLASSSPGDLSVAAKLVPSSLRCKDKAPALAALAAAERSARPEDTAAIAALYLALKEPGKALAFLSSRRGSAPASLWAEAALAAGRPDDLAQADPAGMVPEQARVAAAFHMGRKEPAKAVPYLKRLTAEDPGHAVRWLDLAAAANSAGDQSTALEALSHVRLRMSTLENARRAANLYSSCGQPASAVPFLKRMAERDGAAPGPWLELAATAAAAQDRRQVVEALARADRTGLDSDSLHRMLEIYGRVDEHEAALALLERRGADLPRSSGAWMEFVDRARAAGRQDVALRALDRVSRSGPDPKTNLRVTELYAELGKPEAVKAGLDRAEAAEAGPAEVERMAILAQGLEDLSRALRLLDRAVRLSPGSGRVLGDRGVLKARLGRTREAMEDLGAAIRLDKTLLSAYLTLGGLHAAAGENARALEVYDAGLRVKDPKAPGELRALLQQSREQTAAVQGQPR
ncbi:MAG: hypothetical protein A2X36_16690 [Elusimicrobia bacterium GWA2_69_24]|nr:MAG: hypothetical protein A2X36_16690 [Elusimicrobia bacterium GWA2_69_24]HBL16646.1 hypothetical protein [Elusimicrobiota bacterium]